MTSPTSLEANTRAPATAREINDEDLLAKLGYKQEFKRDFTKLELFGMCFTIVGVVQSIAAVLLYSLPYGGLVGMVWGWFVCCCFLIFVGLAMAELGSAAPTAGGLYYWTFRFCSPRYRNLFSWLIGYVNTAAYIAGMASVDWGVATQVMAAANIGSDGNFVATTGQTYGVFAGKPQLYSELGIYPLAVRRAELAMRYLRYLTTLPESHLAHKALQEADRLRRKGKSSWTGDLARVLADLPFPIRRLPSLRNLSTRTCDEMIVEIRRAARAWIEKEVNSRVSIPLLHGRLEPSESEPPKRIPLCRRHYLTRVVHTNQRLALTRLLCGSFYFRGLRSDPDKHAPASLLCRKCGISPTRFIKPTGMIMAIAV